LLSATTGLRAGAAAPLRLCASSPRGFTFGRIVSVGSLPVGQQAFSQAAQPAADGLQDSLGLFLKIRSRRLWGLSWRL
jgi:hypothetical protein